MREYVKDKWIAALKSGKYKQTRGCLNDGNGYCCLGVLCEVFIAEGNVLDVGTKGSVVTYNNGSVVTYNGEETYPPPDVLRWAGIQHVNGMASGVNYSVTAVNDVAYSFTPSIEYIEQFWENM